MDQSLQNSLSSENNCIPNMKTLVIYLTLLLFYNISRKGIITSATATIANKVKWGRRTQN